MKDEKDLQDSRDECPLTLTLSPDEGEGGNATGGRDELGGKLTRIEQPGLA